MTERTYDELIAYICSQDKPNARVAITIRNNITKKDTVIIDNHAKRYNRAIIVFDPKHLVENNQYAGDNRSFYICSSLEEVEQSALFLLKNADVWATYVDSEDLLEQF